MNPLSVLHITHTTPLKDSRIMRQVESLVRSKRYDVSVYGFAKKGDETDGWVEHTFAPGFSFFLNQSAPTLGEAGLRQLGKKLRSMGFRSFGLLRTLIVFEVARMLLGVHVSSLSKPFAGRAFDVVHCHDWQSLSTALQVARKCGASLIYDSHELASEMNGSGPFRRFLVRTVERRAWGKIDLLITVSQSVVEHNMRIYGQRDFRLIYNSPLTQPGGGFALTRHTISDKLRLGPGQITAVYVGSLTSGRGIDTILAAARLAPPGIHFAFLGSGPREQSVREASEDLDNLSLLTPVAGNEVVSFLRGATVGLCLIEPVCLSYEYSLPNKLFECLFAGLRVVVSNMPELAKVIRSTQGGVVMDESGPAALVEAIREAHKMPEPDPDALGNYSWQNVEKSLLDGYAALNRPG